MVGSPYASRAERRAEMAEFREEVLEVSSKVQIYLLLLFSGPKLFFKAESRNLRSRVISEQEPFLLSQISNSEPNLHRFHPPQMEGPKMSENGDRKASISTSILTSKWIQNELVPNRSKIIPKVFRRHLAATFSLPEI